MKKFQVQRRMAILREDIKNAQSEMTALALKLDQLEEQERRQQEMAKTANATTVGQLVTNLLAINGQFNNFKYYDKRKGGLVRMKVCDVKNPSQLVQAIQEHAKTSELGVTEVRVHRVYRSRTNLGEVVVFYHQPQK